MDSLSDNFVEQLLPIDIGETQRNAIKNKCYDIMIAIKACRNFGKQATFRSDTKTIVMQSHQAHIILRISDTDRPGTFIHLCELTPKLPLSVRNLISGLIGSGTIILESAFIKVTKSVSIVIMGLIISCIYHIDMGVNVKSPIPMFNNFKMPLLTPQNHFKKTKNTHTYQPPKQEVKLEYTIENAEDRTRYHAIVVNDINEFKDRKALVSELADMYELDFKPKESSKFLETCISLEESINMPREVKIPMKPVHNFSWTNAL